MSAPTDPEMYWNADGTPEMIDLRDLAARLEALETRQASIADLLESAWSKIEPAIGEVKPFLDKLEAAPLWKMIAGGKKR